MRFTYLELNNYIGIYNGMGLYNIKIDFSLAKHRVLIIKGTNGSGKSTIMNSLSLFPDGTSSFIPDKSASKIVCVSHKGNNYRVQFFHDIKSNGSRDTTKAFFARMNDNGDWIEMNTSGNVTTYKDLIYSEFKLDPNFFALSRLSMDDRGLGYKKPAERKKFVNSIIESLEVYNDIYKIITKKTSSLKAIMASITTKLGSLGDKEALEKLKDSIESECRSINNSIDECNRHITEIDIAIKTIDPDDSIQNLYKTKATELRKLERELKEKIFSYKGGTQSWFFPEQEAILLAERLEKDYSANAYFKSEIERIRSVNNTIIDQMRQLQSQINDIESQMSSIKSDEYTETEGYLNQAKEDASRIEQIISVTGIDPNQFTKAEYIIALETVHEINALVEDFKFNFDYHTIQVCIAEYAKQEYIGAPPYNTSTEGYKSEIANKSTINEGYIKDIANLEAKVELSKKLENRPKGCKIDSCFFISDALQAASGNPEKELSKIRDDYNNWQLEMDVKEGAVADADVYNNCLNAIRVIIRSIDKNHAILSRLPNGGIFASKAEFFENLLAGDQLKYIDRIYQYIDLANYFEEYQIIQSNIQKYESKLSSLASMKDSMKKLFDIKSGLESSISALKRRSQAYAYVLEDLQYSLSVSEGRISEINDNLIPKVDSVISIMHTCDQYRNELDQYKEQIQFIKDHEQLRNEAVTKLRVLENDLSHKNKDRDDLVYKLGQIKEYEDSLESYKGDMSYLEKIKYYSSPTTGIQIMFMKFYMGNILDKSNRLLSYLFGGQYKLLPFVITDEEFRIPCIGNGYLNDDISSMSSSQLTMISMIISFALLNVSSTEYNVIKMDEIDDPLDEPNRAAFAILMDTIMDNMRTEQCIMISHSSEMITTNADIILLRSDGLGIINENSNIIWDYNQA